MIDSSKPIATRGGYKVYKFLSGLGGDKPLGALIDYGGQVLDLACYLRQEIEERAEARNG